MLSLYFFFQLDFKSVYIRRSFKKDSMTLILVRDN